MNKIADWIGAPLSAGRFALLLGLGILAAYPDVVLGSRAFFFRDFGIFAYPLAHYHRESFWHGEVPLWNPLNNCGIPFLAQWNTLVIYPGSLFYLVFPLSWALSVFCLAHLWLGGLGMYFLAHGWTKNRLAAATAGVIYSFNGMSLNALMWPAVSAAVGWMPWVVLTAELGWARGGRRVIAASVLGAMQMLSGTPEVIVLTWLFIGALAMTRLLEDPQRWGVLARRLVAMILLVAGLSALQLLPFSDLLRHSDRHADADSAAWSMPGTGWANLWVPLFRFYETVHHVYLDAEQAWTSSYYLGASALTLGMVALLLIRERRVTLLGSVLALMLILALGNNGYLYTWLRRAWPQLGLMRYPIKFMFLAAFCAPLLAAFTVGRFQVGSAAERRIYWRTIHVVAGGFLLAGLGIVWFDRCFPAGTDYTSFWTGTWENSLVRLAFFIGALLALYFGNQARKPGVRPLHSLLFLSLLCADFLTHVPRQNPTLSPSAFAPGISSLHASNLTDGNRATVSASAHAFLFANPYPDPLVDFMRKRMALFNDLNLLDGISKLDGFYAVYLREPNQVRNLAYRNNREPVSRLLDFLNVSHSTAPGSLFDWVTRTNFLPFVTAGQRPVFTDDPTTLESLAAPDFSPREVVYLPPGARSRVSAGSATVRVVSSRFTAQRGDIEVEAGDRSLLVISQAFYPAWHAFLDGRRVPLWRANYAFQAVETAAGRHHLELIYRDVYFSLGVVVSGFTLLTCLVFAAVAARQGKEKAQATCLGLDE